MLSHSARCCARRIQSSRPSPSSSIHTQALLQASSHSSSPSALRSIAQSSTPVRRPRPLGFIVPSRWYSEATSQAEQQKEGESAARREGEGEPSAETKEEDQDPIKKELEAKKKEAIDFRDKFLRSKADFQNLQERTRREVKAARDFALQNFAKDLIGSVDNLDLALSNVAADKLAAPSSSSQEPSSQSQSESQTPAPLDPSDPYKDLRELHSGLKMTESILMNTLSKWGLERFDPSDKSEQFDPNVHEATFQAPQPGKEDGSCFYTTQKGFSLNGRVVRAAKVGVVKNG